MYKMLGGHVYPYIIKRVWIVYKIYMYIFMYNLIVISIVLINIYQYDFKMVKSKLVKLVRYYLHSKSHFGYYY